MTRPRPPPYPELPMDLVDATGLLGALAGALSIVAPFFFGLTAALGAMLLSSGILRRVDAKGRGAPDDAIRRRFLFGFATALAAWAFVFFHPAATDRFLGAVIGTAGLPLWSVARRAQPFGGS